jgi:hypothetical protein
MSGAGNQFNCTRPNEREKCVIDFVSFDAIDAAGSRYRFCKKISK